MSAEAQQQAPARAGYDTPFVVPLPDPMARTWFGPATGRRLVRTAVIGALVGLVGILLMVFAPGPWGAFGLGLWAPGAGFLYPDTWLGPVLFVVSFALVALCLLVWYATGAILAPFGVWLLAAGGAALLTGSDDGGRLWAQIAVPVLVVAVVARQVVRSRGRHRRAQGRGETLNEVLRSPAVPTAPRFGASTPPRVPELTAEDLAHQRHLLELGLQPVDEFEGFSMLEQWQLGAVRYQLGDVASAIAIGQYVHTPAFHGAVSAAQRGLLDKYTQPVVWRYWFYENLIGNLRWDADPIVRDNIMLSGYLDRYIGYYHSATGDDRYGRPGSFVFEWDADKSYVYDHHSINRSVVDNFRRCDLGLFPCEPNFVFPVCNVRGMSGVKVYDTLYGTNHFGELYDAFRRGLEIEFSEPDGAMHFVRTTRFGVNLWKHWPEDVARGGLATYLNGILPDLAEREYRLFLDAHGEGRLEIPFRLTGRRSDFPGLNAGAPIARTEGAGAREMGDDELAEAFVDAAAYLNPEVDDDGVLRYPFPMGRRARASAQLYENRAGRAGAHYDIQNVGLPQPWRTGPLLADAPHPQVLVASAYTDGAALDLVLRPGRDGGRFDLRLERLRPGGRYDVVGAVDRTVTADEHGTAGLQVDLSDRLPVTVSPQTTQSG